MESLMEAWTDDIPICRSAGIGTVNNEIYRKDGRRVEMHPMRCRSANDIRNALGERILKSYKV